MAHSSRPADARRSTSRQNSGNWDAFLFFPLHQQASTNLWQGRCGAPSCNVYHDMIDQLLMSLHPNLGILSRKKSHNLTEHPHVLWKQRHESPLHPLLPSRLKWSATLGFKKHIKKYMQSFNGGASVLYGAITLIIIAVHSPNKNGKWLTKFPKDSDRARF